MEQDLLQQHIAYNAWATNRLINAVSSLTEEQLQRDFGTADKSIAGTMIHLFRSERVWLSRLKEEPVQAVFQLEAKWESLQTDWPNLQIEWKEWAAKLSEEDFRCTLHYSDLRGNSRSNKLWEILMQVINHGTHHRGQVSGFLRALGTVPPPLDYIAFVRERQAAS